MKSDRSLKVTVFLLTLVMLTALTGINSFATLSEDSKYVFSSETIATEEEWKAEQDISGLDLNPEEKKDITVCLNTDLLDITGLQKPMETKGTLYVPMRAFFESAGFDVKVNGFTGKITLTIEGEKSTCRLFSKKCTVNGTEYILDSSVIYKRGCIYVPINLISYVMNAKVWYDEDGKNLTVSTGKYKDDEILRIVNGKLYMNGEPYYEISFNKFDLCYQIHAAYYHNHEWPDAHWQHESAEDALRLLNEKGFKSIRVFVNSNYRGVALNSEEDNARYMQAMDDLFDLCDKYDVKMVVCMNLFDGAFCTGGEKWIDLVGDLGSQSFARLEKHVREFVERFKDRKTVLMWEITNEGNLEADLKKISARQIGLFYERVANIIHDVDPERLVTGGDGCLRDSQWHMYTKSRTGVDNFWGNDTLKQRFMAYQILYHGLDVISIHPYGVGTSTNYHFVEEDVFEVKNVDFDYLKYEADVMGKPLYNGEVAVNADNPLDDNQRNIDYLNYIIDAGIQISHWWTFHTDRQGFNDGYGWDITYGELLDIIIDANKRIKERYCVNKYAESSVEDSNKESIEYFLTNSAEIKGKISDIPAFVIVIPLILAAVIVTLSLKNKKKKKKGV